MRKIILIIFVLFLVGCGKKEYITCNVEVNNKVQNYTMNGTYKIYFDNSYVTKIEKQEEYISEEKDMIDYFYEYKNLEYQSLNELYNGFDYIVNQDDNIVNVNVNIDMNLVDINKMIKNDYLNKNYVISNKITTSGVVKIYESKGAICDI